MSGDAWLLHGDRQRDALIDHLQSLDLEKPVTVKIKSGVKRTELQNAFLWGWIYTRVSEVLNDAGIVIHCDDGTEHPYTKDVIHEVMRRKYLMIGEITSKGRTLPIIRSTTELNTKEFCEYVENVREFAESFWRITVPEPIGRHRNLWDEWMKDASLMEVKKPEQNYLPE